MIRVVQMSLTFTPTNDRQQILILLFISKLPNTVKLEVVMPSDDVFVLWNIPLELSAGPSSAKLNSSTSQKSFVLFTAQCMVALTSTGEYTNSSPSPGLTKKNSIY